MADGPRTQPPYLTRVDWMSRLEAAQQRLEAAVARLDAAVRKQVDAGSLARQVDETAAALARAEAQCATLREVSGVVASRLDATILRLQRVLQS